MDIKDLVLDSRLIRTKDFGDSLDIKITQEGIRELIIPALSSLVGNRKLDFAHYSHNDNELWLSFVND